MVKENDTEYKLAQNPELGIIYAYDRSSFARSPHVAVDRDEALKGSAIAYWGDMNTYPQNVLELIEKNTIVLSTLDFKARAMYGLGIEYGTETIENGARTFMPLIDNEIEEWLENSLISEFLYKALQDFYTFGNVFPELIFTLGKEKVAGISCKEAMHCRYEKQNSRGNIMGVYIKTDWRTNPTDLSIAKRLPVLNRFLFNSAAVRETAATNYIMPITYNSVGKTYYQTPAWHSLINSKWLEVATKIPEFKIALLKNQATIKYMVKVPSYYWAWKYPNWDKMETAEKNKAMDDTFSAFERILTDTQGAGKTVFTHFISGYDSAPHSEFPGWAIEAIDDKIKDGIYIEDSQEASSHILYALGVPSTLIGNAPGRGGNGAGSGSDIREAFNMYSLLNNLHEDILLEPLNFIARYNNWNGRLGKRIKFRFQKQPLLTLNQISPADRTLNLNN